MPGMLIVPFTTIDLAYKTAFDLYLTAIVGNVITAVSGPLLACVTLWVIVQGILVMRGDIDPRRGITKLVSVAIVVGLVTSSTLYHDYVENMFHTAIPTMVTGISGNPTSLIPLELDGIFKIGQAAFHRVAAEIPEMDELDSMAFEGAQFFFYFTLWSIFGTYHIVEILTSVLLTVGPLFILGFLFEQTQGITTRWVGQLVSYAIMLLLISLVATVVVLTIATFMAGVFLATIVAGTTASKIVGLYEMDMFIMTGNALIVAIPAIAGSIGGGVGSNGSQIAQSMMRGFARQPGGRNDDGSRRAAGTRVSGSTRNMGMQIQ